MEVHLGMYLDSSHGLIPWELLSLLLTAWERGNSRLKSFACPTEVQVGMYYDCSHGLVSWELLS